MRLIDADELDNKLSKKIKLDMPEYNRGIIDAGYVIAEMPTVDAVQVIRCKHCPFYKSREGDFPWCKRFEVGTQDDDYCEIDSVIEDKLQEDK